MHPEVITTYVEGALTIEGEIEETISLDQPAALTTAETAVLTLLRQRLSLTLKDKLEASLEQASANKGK